VVSIKRRVSNRQLGGVLAVAAVLLMAGAGAYAMAQNAKPTPDRVFQKFLAVTMSSNSMAQTVKAPGSTIDYKFEFSDVRKPKVSAKGTTDIYRGTTLTVQGYDDAESSYARTSYQNPQGQSAADPAMPKAFDSGWVQIRENGELPATYASGNDYVRSILDTVADGHIGTNGDFIMGNFSDGDRQDFINFINSKHVYSYDSHMVSREMLDGKPVFKYPVQVDKVALGELNQQVARVTGADGGFLAATTSATTLRLQSTLYVGINDARLLKVVTSDGKTTATVTYGGFETTSIGRAPQPASKWGQTKDKLESLGARSAVN
jgi:hypothetical protein